MSQSMEELRKSYALGALDIDDVDPDPIAQFRHWFDQVRQTSSSEANAMIVATVDADGRPSARTVLLKHVDYDGFIFYTNYDSRKGHDLAYNPSVALVFYWPSLERQVRIMGIAHRTDATTSDAYFHSRPIGSQIGAAASPQSEVVPDRTWLEARFAALEAESGDHICRPAEWGGYLVIPDEIEFWQGRPNRVHDRIRFRRDETRWQIERLAP